MSGPEVIGGIFIIVDIIDALIKTYNSPPKDLELSETFEAVGRTLQTCKSHLERIQSSSPTDVCDALKKIMAACDEKAGGLFSGSGQIILDAKRNQLCHMISFRGVEILMVPLRYHFNSQEEQSPPF